MNSYINKGVGILKVASVYAWSHIISVLVEIVAATDAESKR
jgi:hypothetical protein